MMEYGNSHESISRLSVVICTYNRVDILKLTLPTYEELLLPSGVELEIIVVDNNSSDETATFIQDYIARLPSARCYRYVFEPKQGISHARNAGFKHATGSYVAYTDDECELPNNWLIIAWKTIQRHHPAFLGGPYYGKRLPGITSLWFKESFGDSYLLKDKPVYGPLINHYLSGGNMLIRRDVFEAIDAFDPELGMCGKKTAYGEEQDFQKRYLAKYPQAVIFYDPELFVWHYVRTEKMSIRYLFKDALFRGFYAAKAKDKSLGRILFAPVLMVIFSLRALICFVSKAIKSLYSREHFYTLLYQDYTDNVWRPMGFYWYNLQQLPSTISELFHVKKKPKG